MKEQILEAWECLKATPFPDAPRSEPLVEIRAELANISTFGSGCLHTFLQKGQLGPGHHSVLMNCLDAVQKLGGKLSVVHSSGLLCDPMELQDLLLYKESLERLLEAILIGCTSEQKDNEP